MLINLQYLFGLTLLPNGLEIQVVETGVYSGIFKGRVFVADSGDTAKNRLVSIPGDTVYAKYVDFTMPDGSTSEHLFCCNCKNFRSKHDSTS